MSVSRRQFLTALPHSNYKLNVFNLSVLGSFKTFFNATVGTWIHREIFTAMIFYDNFQIDLWKYRYNTQKSALFSCIKYSTQRDDFQCSFKVISSLFLFAGTKFAHSLKFPRILAQLLMIRKFAFNIKSTEITNTTFIHQLYDTYCSKIIVKCY